ncbi:MAG: NAD(P)H-binding protein [Sphingorhabdus sp.]
MTGNVILAGGSGLVGRQVVNAWHGNGSLEMLHLLLRRPLAVGGGLTTHHVASPEDWPNIIAGLGGHVAICCLGTTMKQAGSKAAFIEVDLELVVRFATASKRAGARHFIVISSVGADATSSNFYLSVKGRVEDELRALGFDRLDIMRPGLLRGERKGKKRSTEAIGIWLSPVMDLLMQGSLQRYRSIDSAVVAHAVINLSMQSGAGIFIHENESITALAG